jgi:hypothetical protein
VVNIQRVKTVTTYIMKYFVVHASNSSVGAGMSAVLNSVSMVCYGVVTSDI